MAHGTERSTTASLSSPTVLPNPHIFIQQKLPGSFLLGLGSGDGEKRQKRIQRKPGIIVVECKWKDGGGNYTEHSFDCKAKRDDLLISGPEKLLKEQWAQISIPVEHINPVYFLCLNHCSCPHLQGRWGRSLVFSSCFCFTFAPISHLQIRHAPKFELYSSGCVFFGVFLCIK